MQVYLFDWRTIRPKKKKRTIRPKNNNNNFPWLKKDKCLQFTQKQKKKCSQNANSSAYIDILYLFVEAKQFHCQNKNKITRTYNNW